MSGTPERLERAKDALERRLDDIAESHAGRPKPVVLDALEHAVRRSGVTPRRADLSALAERISHARPDAP